MAVDVGAEKAKHCDGDDADDAVIVVVAAKSADGGDGVGDGDGDDTGSPMGVFGKYLSVWVLLCIVLGTAIGATWPDVADWFAGGTVAEISMPVAVLIWIMITPMMMQIDFAAIRDVPRHPGGLFLTTGINWAVQPFAMYAFAVLFFNYIYEAVLTDDEQDQYVAGAVILGGSPCTAMVFVWSALTRGNHAYTLVQVALNDVILLFLYVPTIVFLLDLSDIALPWDTVILSVLVFVVIPGVVGVALRHAVIRTEGEKGLARIDRLAHPVTATALLAMLVLIFIFQGETIVDNWPHILLIMLPLSLQTLSIFTLAYSLAYFFGLRHEIAAPAALIGSSNFFELGVAVALTVYGLDSGATLANVVGVLVEVPLMLALVAVANSTRDAVNRRAAEEPMREVRQRIGQWYRGRVWDAEGIHWEKRTVNGHQELYVRGEESRLRLHHSVLGVGASPAADDGTAEAGGDAAHVRGTGSRGRRQPHRHRHRHRRGNEHGRVHRDARHGAESSHRGGAGNNGSVAAAGYTDTLDGFYG